MFVKVSSIFAEQKRVLLAVKKKKKLRFLSVISQCPSGNISYLLNVIIQFSIRSNRIKHVKGSITLKPIQLLKTSFKKVGFSHLPPLFVISH